MRTQESSCGRGGRGGVFPTPPFRGTLKRAGVWIGTLLLFSVLSLPMAEGGEVVLLYSQNIVGTLKPLGKKGEIGGLARRASYIKRLREEGRALLILDAGDLFYRPPFGRPSAPAGEDDIRRAEALVKAFNEMGCDAIALGEKDLALGVEALERLQEEANFPFLCLNLILKDGRHPFQASVIRERGGYCWAIAGVMGRDVRVPEPFYLESPYEGLARLLPSLRRRADFVVLLAHGGWSFLGRLLGRFPEGIDIVILGHSRPVGPTVRRVKNTLVAQCWSGRQTLGRLDLRVKAPHRPFRFPSEIRGLREALKIIKGRGKRELEIRTEEKIAQFEADNLCRGYTVTLSERIPEDPHIKKIVEELTKGSLRTMKTH